MESIPHFLSSPCLLSPSVFLLSLFPFLFLLSLCINTFVSSSSPCLSSLLLFPSFLSSTLRSYPSFLSFHPFLVFTVLLLLSMFLLLFSTSFLSSSSPSLILVPPNFHPFCFCHFRDSFPPPLSLSPLLFCPCHLVLPFLPPSTSLSPVLLLFL